MIIFSSGSKLFLLIACRLISSQTTFVQWQIASFGQKPSMRLAMGCACYDSTQCCRVSGILHGIKGTQRGYIGRVSLA